ncbi:hypothetical protein Nepgr_004104 [Nepenthes gracilis]|uniref:Uncharacterized protein n=1 Tax=Nepenthes gracilis TaxID=150966 RepID=A0AAD3XET2_NEPGR|nr:hypothetical protein Nepgr_004104 [Nepenthes gracilis]
MLSGRYYRPFQIIEQVGAVREAKAAATTLLRSIFHVTMPEKMVGDFTNKELLSFNNEVIEEEETVWEDYNEIALQFPDFGLVDKGLLKEGENDRTWACLEGTNGSCPDKEAAL